MGAIADALADGYTGEPGADIGLELMVIRGGSDTIAGPTGWFMLPGITISSPGKMNCDWERLLA